MTAEDVKVIVEDVKVIGEDVKVIGEDVKVIGEDVKVTPENVKDLDVKDLDVKNLEPLTQEEMDAVIYDARVGDVEVLKEIFDEIPKSYLLTIKDDISLSTPIHMAAANGHLDTIKYLLSIISKDDAVRLVQAKNDTGNTALHWAAYNGHLEVVKYLVEFEADPFAKNEAGHDSIYEAENNGKTQVENWFLSKYAPEEDFSIASDGDTTRVTYAPGTESKLADENARDAVFATSINTGEKGEGKNKEERKDESPSNPPSLSPELEGIANVSINDDDDDD